MSSPLSLAQVAELVEQVATATPGGNHQSDDPDQSQSGPLPDEVLLARLVRLGMWPTMSPTISGTIGVPPRAL